MSKNAGRREMREANQLMRENIARLEAIGIPAIEAQKIALESPELVGLLEAETLSPSRFEDVQMDPRLQSAQMAALQDITGIAEAGGLDAMSRLNLEEGLRRASGAEQARLQQLTEDPTLGQGQRLALQSQAVQGAGQSSRDVALQSAAQAQQARMAALQQQASMASGMQQQQLGLAGQKATRADEINLENKRAREAINLFNAQQRQNIANMGTEARNKTQLLNQQLIQQKFQNELAKATGVTGQQSQMATNLQQQAAAAQQGQQAMTSGLIQAGAIGAGAALGGGLPGALAAKKLVG
jgi:hypothetical protein